MNKLRAVLGIIVFSGGLLGGTAAAQLVNPPPPPLPPGMRSLPTVEEPAPSAGVAALLLADDARALAKALDPDLLQKLGSAIEPLVDIDEITFTGATERQGDILSSYVAGGRSQNGERVIVGIVFRVRDGKVVGVN